jgi:hypothetical protein
MLFFKLKTDGVVFWVGKVRETLNHAHYEEDRGVDSDRNTGVALFNLDQRGPADGGALSRDGHGDAPPPPGVADIVAQLAQRMPDGDWQYDRCSARSHV